MTKLTLVEPTVLAHPAPPAYMSDEQARLWRSIAESKPAHWWRGTEPLLHAYVDAASTHRKLSEHLATIALTDLRRFSLVLGMMHRQVSSMTSLARTMKLTPRLPRAPA